MKSNKVQSEINLIDECDNLHKKIEFLLKQKEEMTKLSKQYEQIVTLNVGGQLFSTTEQTLTKEKYKIPDGTQTGTKFIIRNKGFKSVNSTVQGDFVFTVIVKTPKRLTKEQRDLFMQLAKTMNEQPPIKRKGIFG